MYYISRQLQMVNRKEQDIRQFFEQFGPSARDCYAFCATISDHHAIVCNKVKRMGWNTLPAALISGTDSLHMDEGSHKVILISPDPENRTRPLPSIITLQYCTSRHKNDGATPTVSTGPCSRTPRRNQAPARDGFSSYPFMRYV